MPLPSRFTNFHWIVVVQEDLLLSKSIRGPFQCHDRGVTLPNTLSRVMETYTLDSLLSTENIEPLDISL